MRDTSSPSGWYVAMGRPSVRSSQGPRFAYARLEPRPAPALQVACNCTDSSQPPSIRERSAVGVQDATLARFIDSRGEDAFLQQPSVLVQLVAQELLL